MKKAIRVYLRAFEPEDHIKIHRWRNEKDIIRNFGGIPRFSSTLNEKKWLEEKIFDKMSVNCAICLKENDEFVGCVFLTDIDLHNRSGHAPVYIGEKKYWGKGYATEARILILKHAFLDRGLNRVWATVLEDNGRAVKMLEKCGYRHEGIMRQASFKDGVFLNEYLFAVLKNDFMDILGEYDI